MISAVKRKSFSHGKIDLRVDVRAPQEVEDGLDIESVLPCISVLVWWGVGCELMIRILGYIYIYI